MSVALLPLTAVGHARHHAGHHARLHRHAGLHALPAVRLLLLHVLLRVHLLRVALRRLAVPRLLLITLLLLTTLLVVALLAVVRPAAVHFWAGSLRLRGGREPVWRSSWLKLRRTEACGPADLAQRRRPMPAQRAFGARGRGERAPRAQCASRASTAACPST